MKKFENTIIIGIDHGFGNVKTEQHIFPSGVKCYDEYPAIDNNLLIYNGKYYLIGAGHKPFTADKFTDMDYYVMTLAAIAMELQDSGITNADVHIAAGLPLTWVEQQRKEFKQYLMQNETVDFAYKGTEYHIRIVGTDIFPQGFSAVANKLFEFRGINMLCDIGNGTMNVMYINDKIPNPQKCFSEKFGTNQCVLRIRENLMKKHHLTLPEESIHKILTYNQSNLDADILKTISDTAREYTAEIFQRLKEYEYNPTVMKLYIVGGGGCLIRNFADYNKNRVIINGDIHATAKGYEYLSELKLKKEAEKNG